MGRLYPPAEYVQGPLGGSHLFLRLRAFHREQPAAEAGEREAVFQQHRERGEGAGEDEVVVLAGGPGPVRPPRRGRLRR